MLSACSECPLPLLAEHQGISYYRWGEDSDQDLTRRFAPPAFDYLGRGGPLAVMEDYVFRTAEISEMQALIDSSLDIMPSLADAQEYALLAEGITELNLYSVFLSDQTQQGVRGMLPAEVPEEQIQALEEKLKDSPLLTLLLRPYTALALGNGRDDSGGFAGVVLVHSDDEAANENASLLSRRLLNVQSLRMHVPWTELIDAVEIRAEERLLLAKFYTETPGFGINMYHQRESLLVHE